MSVQVLTPGTKPIVWNLEPDLVDHKWGGFWARKPAVVLPLWSPKLINHGTFKGLTPTIEAGAAWSNTSGAHVSTGGGQGGQHIGVAKPWDQDATTYTWLMLIDYVGVADADENSTLIQYNDGGGAGRTVLMIADANDTEGTLSSFVISASRTANTTLTLGNRYLVGFEKSGTNFRFWLNGKDDGTFTGTATAADGTINFGSHKDGVTENGFEGNILGIYGFDSVLPPKLHHDIYVDFFGAVRPDLRIIGKAPAVVGGLSIPVAMYNYRRRRVA